MGWFSEVFGGGQKPRKVDFVQLLQNGGGTPAQGLDENVRLNKALWHLADTLRASGEPLRDRAEVSA